MKLLVAKPEEATMERVNIIFLQMGNSFPYHYSEVSSEYDVMAPVGSSKRQPEWWAPAVKTVPRIALWLVTSF